MSSTDVIEHDQNENRAPAAAPEQKPEPVTAEVLPEPEADQAPTPLAKRAELIPVGATGATPMTMAQQIDFGQYMAKARAAIPPHLQGNVGDCLAVIDIASRAGLSPYMVASKTYVQNGRLAFESQLFHALLVQSGVLKGDLEVTWDGDGDDMTCTVTGILKSDGKARTHTSEKLKDARPAMNSSGQIKGSPLWKDKPKVQLFYDTGRDWIRMYAPTATLGIYERHELIEHPLPAPDGAITVNDTDPSLHKRLKGVNRDEGHQPGQAAAELASVGAGGSTAKIKPAKEKKTRSAAVETPKPGSRAARRAERAQQAAKPATAKATPATTNPGQNVTKATAKVTKQPDKVTKSGKPGETAGESGDSKSPIQQRAEREQAAAPGKLPKTAVEYWGYADNWIKADVPKGRKPDDYAGDLEARWDDERAIRDDLGVPVPRRKEMETALKARCQELRGE